MIKLPKTLNEIRKRNKLTQQDMAKKLGIARTTYAMYEQGNREPDYETLIKIADVFNEPIEYLLTGEKKDIIEEKKGSLFFYDVDGLTQEEIDDIERHIQYVKWKAENERQKGR